jgi:HEPN domain-containing protein
LLEITIKVDEQDAEELIELAKRLVQAVEKAVEILEEIIEEKK